MARRGAELLHGVGNRSGCPLAYLSFQCSACKTTFPFLKRGVRRCLCVKKGGKFGSWKVHVNGVAFASLLEGERYAKLSFLNSSEVIKDLTIHPSFNLFGPAEALVCRYIADFQYQYQNNVIVEDTKGRVTPVFALKRKLFHANYPSYFLDVIYAER